VPMYPGATERFRMSETLPEPETVRAVEAGETARRDIAEEVDRVKLASPLYWALMVTSPAAKEVAV
jgi:hypothetical protein